MKELYSLLMAEGYGITEEDLNDLKEQIEMKRKSYILKQHKYAITKASDGRWRTFLPNEHGRKGKEIRKKTRNELELYLVDFYEGNREVVTFKECYDEWASYHHRKANNNDNTRYKYQTDYQRFIFGTDLEAKEIGKITESEIDEFLIGAIYDNNLTYKSFGRLFGYLSGTFKRAKRLKLIEENPMEFLEKRDYYETCRKGKVKTSDTELVSDEDFAKLLAKLYSDMDLRPEYLTLYAVELAALTGMRVAELAALKWEDIDFESGYINIVRSDKCNRLTGEWTVEETKTGKIRKFPIDETIEKSLLRLKKAQEETDQESEWLFPNKSYGWTHSNLISSCLKNKCLQIGLSRTYGVHAFRKTLNSGMRTGGASALLCSGMMGNSVEVNNNYYSYDTSNMDEKREYIALEHAKRDFR